MRHLILRENAPAIQTELTPLEAEALSALELAQVTRVIDGSWMVAAGSKVGVTRLGDLQVTVRPKISIDRLVFLMGYAQKPSYWRDQTATLDPHSDLPEALAHAFRRLAAKALDQGLLQGYRTVDESLPVLRGRLRTADQISRRAGLGLPLEVTYDDFSVDIPENQILLAASVRLLRMPGIPPAVRQGLQRLRFQLGEVSILPRKAQVPAWIPSRLNKRYHAALRLAELILRGDSIEQRVGDVDVSGFVIDMWRIFEDFVCVGLREALLSAGGSASLQHGMHLDQARRVVLRPDFVWTSRSGHKVVADAKYKAEKPSGFPQADLYQLLAYCTVLGLQEGHLIYAKGNEEDTSHHVVRSAVTIHCHTVDLQAPPAELLEQINGIGHRLMSQKIAQ